MKKIIFIDIDGTLCNSKGEVTEETVRAIKKTQEQGNVIVLSTGRRLNRVIPLMKRCNIHSYILALNGAQIYDSMNSCFLLEEDIGFSNSFKIYQLIQKYSLHGNFIQVYYAILQRLLTLRIYYLQMIIFRNFILEGFLRL